MDLIFLSIFSEKYARSYTMTCEVIIQMTNILVKTKLLQKNPLFCSKTVLKFIVYKNSENKIHL